MTCEEVGCQCVETSQLQEKCRALAVTLGIDPVKQQILEAEMRLANIRAICNAVDSVTPGQALGLLRAIGEVASRPVDEPMHRVLKDIQAFQLHQDECRRLAADLLKFAGPEEPT